MPVLQNKLADVVFASGMYGMRSVSIAGGLGLAYASKVTSTQSFRKAYACTVGSTACMAVFVDSMYATSTAVTHSKFL